MRETLPSPVTEMGHKTQRNHVPLLGWLEGFVCNGCLCFAIVHPPPTAEQLICKGWRLVLQNVGAGAVDHARSHVNDWAHAAAWSANGERVFVVRFQE